jgi:hypothetical protein
MEERTMHATLRRLRCAPGQASEVARLIETEYVPQLSDVDGVQSYTLVEVGVDEITSLGIFADQPAAARANELALAWARDRLAALGAAPLQASDGAVLLHVSFGT